MPLWRTTLSDPRPSCSPMEYYDDRMLFVLGHEIVEVHQGTGKIMRRVSLKFSPTTSAARSDKHIFVGSSDKRFYCLRLEDGIILWHSVQPQEPLGAVRVKDDKVYFCGKDGALYVSRTGERDLLWKTQTAGETFGVVIDDTGQECYLPSSDTGLYCLNGQTGKPLWKYLSGGKLTELPELTGRFVYQGVEQSSLLCLERSPASSAGTLRWELKNGSRFLAENGVVSYAMTHNNELTIMNNETGKRELSFYVPGMELFASNKEGAMIFMANRAGTIVALKPNK